MAMSQSWSFGRPGVVLALWRSGDKVKALETQKMAVSLAGADKNIPAETVQEMKDRLKQFGG